MNGLQPLASRFSVYLALVSLVLAGGATFAMAQGRPTIAEKTEGMEVLDGFFPMYWDGNDGTLWMEIARFDSDLLYVRSLAAGVGSNDIGLDRGQIGASALVRFERVGPKVLMVQPNQRFRVETDNPDEVRALDEAFATSVLWGFTVEAETDGAVLIDVTPFVLRDAHGAADRLPGTYRLDESRSAVYLPRTKGFPQNTELEATLTFTGDGRGSGPGFGRGSIRAVAPTAQAVTMRQHHSFVELPDDGYTPRPYDPRAGYGAMSYDDYGRAARRADDQAIPTAAPSRGSGTRRPPSARRSSRSSTTSTVAPPSRCGRRCSRARAGGTRPSRRPGIATPSRSG